MVKSFRATVLGIALNISVHKNLLGCLLKGRFGASDADGSSFTLWGKIEAVRTNVVSNGIVH